MKKRRTLLMCWISLMTLAGCAGTGEIVPLQIHPLATGAGVGATQNAPLRVAMGPFEDSRSHHTNLGVRTHLWGGVSYFDVPGGKPADAVALALADYLTAKGWQVVTQEAGAADVLITGRILDLSVHAKSRVGFTEITTNTKLSLQAENLADGSTIRLTLHGKGRNDVFWFEPEDVQSLLNDVLGDTFRKVIQDTIVENKRLRLKYP
ncbi:MAG: hypothetical protein NTX84_01670 [Nitrospirae bacterium]|nr:hypothetical protein [Nitrospirota bacterium]